MTDRLDGDKKVVGVKQVKRAVNSSAVSQVYVAKDADQKITQDIVLLCQRHEIPIEKVDTMKELGDACGIDINAATAALLI